MEENVIFNNYSSSNYKHDAQQKNTTITNFCKNKECLMPLCPICIREHADYHQQTQTKPNYYSIAETVQDAEKHLIQTIQTLEKHQKKLGNIIKENYEFHQSIKDRLIEAKQVAIKWVEEKFQSFEVETLKKLSFILEEKGVKSIEQTNSHYQDVQHKINELYKMFQSLKTERFLATIISFLKIQANQINKTSRLYASYIESQVKVLPKLSLNLDIRNHFMNTIDKIIKITLQEKPKQKSPRTSPIPSNRILTSSRFGRPQKNENHYTPQNSARFLKNEYSEAKMQLSNNKHPNSPYYLHGRSLDGSLNQTDKQNSPFLLSHRNSQRSQANL